MKEIDFLPEWYKSGRRRQVSYRTQYFVLGGIFTVLLVWNFVTSYSISKAQAQVVETATQQRQSQRVSARLAELKNELNILNKKQELMESIDSRINIADILAEMSYLIDDKIVLSEIELISEKFADEPAQNSPSGGAVVRAFQPNMSIKGDSPIGDARFKILIAGVAADAGDVATLILKMENSPYFCQVALSFSKNADIKIKNDNSFGLETERTSESTGTRQTREPVENIKVSKFEISCYLANYRRQ